MSYLELVKFAGPECVVALAAFAVLGVDLLVMRHEPIRARAMLSAAIAGLGCLIGILWLANVELHGSVANGMLAADPLIRLAKLSLLVLTLFTIVISIEANFTHHIGEYFALLLMGTIGMLFLVSAEEILMIFLALELTSLSLYIMTAFNKRSLASAEAGLKYFLFGGMAAAFTLFGLSFIYGLSGSMNLREVAGSLAHQGMSPLLLAALIMVVIGFGFKVAAVPFHLWAPDAYQGAPVPAAAFIASGSKVASFFILAKIMMVGFDGLGGSGEWRQFAAGWMPLLAVVAALSMLLGNLAALAQSNVKRLLAYSAIAHAGYALLGVIAGAPNGLASLVYYVVTYALTTLGAFGVIALIEDGAGDAQMSRFAGLSRRSPVLAFAMMIFMLSLAGIPPLAGFIGKFYLFASAAGVGAGNLGLMWLVIIAIGTSAISLYYYLQVLKQIYVLPPNGEAGAIPALGFTSVAVLVLAIAVLVLGCAPGLLLNPLSIAVK